MGDVRGRALANGWKKVPNRNGMLKFELRQCHVHWFRNGRVMLYFDPAKSLGHAKALFCEAFKFMPVEELLKCVDTVKPFSRHRVFDLEERLPKAEIRLYQASYGLNIKLGDGSHPTCVEVAETRPFWLDEFSENIESHMELLEKWKEESELRLMEQRRRLFDSEPIRVMGLKVLPGAREEIFKYLPKELIAER